MSIVGNKYNRLTVVAELDQRHKGNLKRCVCICECGNFCSAQDWMVRIGRTKSCGCLVKEAKQNVTHGLRKHPLYKIWTSMKNRCTNPVSDSFPDYGGRGISVCQVWMEDFKSFYEWSIKDGWKKGLEIDRIDVNGNYSPDNCRYVNTMINALNRRPKGSQESLGVVYYEHLTVRKYKLKIRIQDKPLHFGYFYTKEEAIMARQIFMECLCNRYGKSLRDEISQQQERFDHFVETIRKMTLEKAKCPSLIIQQGVQQIVSEFLAATPTHH